MKTKFALIFGLLFLLALGFGAVAEEEVRYGAWLDEIVGIRADSDVALAMIEAGELHVFADDMVCPEMFARAVASPYIEYEKLFGVFAPLMFNTAGDCEDPTFADGRLNPFAVRRIREAMHWLIDRYYIAEELWGGLAIPRFFPISPVFPDYTRLIETARRLELYYAHDPARAEAVITEEMYKIGAERVDGIWHWYVEDVGLEPVEIIFLTRTEDARLHLGRYVGKLLEEIGFKTRQWYVTAAEASPVWIHGEPYDGEFHVATLGWISTTISRDQGGTINAFFTPRGWGIRLWAEKDPAPELYELALRLSMRDFECMDERAELFGRVLELAMQEGALIHTVNSIGFMPRCANLALAADLAGGIGGAVLWPYTMRFEDPVTGEPVVGGTAIIAMPSLLTDPWNPIAGTGWIFDRMFQRATWDYGTIPDPFTGLRHPNRLKRSEVWVREGLPVEVTLDWVCLHFVPEAIEVHPEAWVDWCVAEQRFYTLETACPEWAADRRVADVKIRAHFPADLFDIVRWHDGSPLTLADIVMGMIIGYERADPESPLFDEGVVRGRAAFMRHFRGVRIVSEDPLIIDSWTNRAWLDAEWLGTWHWYAGGTPWHNLVPGNRARAAKELAWSTRMAGELEVEWTNFIAGPSLPILERHLADAKAIAYIPWEPTMGQFITPEEAVARYANLQNWFAERGHFWVGQGPFYLVAAHPIEMIVHLRRNPYFPDPAERWVGFAAPKIAEVDVTGPAIVIAGDEAAFDIEITFEGEPYPVADIDMVTYLLLDALGEIIYVGEAVAIADGLWQAVLPGELTAGLVTGTTRLEVAVVSYLVAIPTFEAATFVLLPR